MPATDAREMACIRRGATADCGFRSSTCCRFRTRARQGSRPRCALHASRRVRRFVLGCVPLGYYDSAMTQGILFDLEGTLHVGERPIPGAAEAVAAVRARGLPCRFLTNTTTRSSASLHARVKALGLPIAPGELFSAPQAAVMYLRQLGSPRCLLLLNEDVRPDFGEFPQSETEPEVIVVGDIGARWDADLMQRMFGMMLAGARLVTLHKGRYWEAGDGLKIDIGAFVAALEFASGQDATVIGKPSPELFKLALDSMHLTPERVAMVGDDVETDVRAAQLLGMKGILVKTGKYRPELLGGEGLQPDAVLDSVRQLPAWLDGVQARAPGARSRAAS